MHFKSCGGFKPQLPLCQVTLMLSVYNLFIFYSSIMPRTVFETHNTATLHIFDKQFQMRPTELPYIMKCYIHDRIFFSAARSIVLEVDDHCSQPRNQLSLKKKV